MDTSIERGWRGERRTRLLEAAARVFSRSSFSQASMDEIAHEGGVGKPTLYRYFSSKEALFAAVFVAALDELECRLERILDREQAVEPRIRSLVGALIPTFRDHLVSLRLLGQDAAVLDQSKRRIFRDRKARIAGFLAAAIEEGIRAGEVRPVEALRLAHLILGMIWSGTAFARAGEDDAVAAEITTLVMNGIGHPARTGSEPRPAQRCATTVAQHNGAGRSREVVRS